MKPKHFALPAIALVIAGILLGLQRENVPGNRVEPAEFHEPIDLEIEAATVFGLFAADPAKAEARLSDLPAEVRAEMLRQADRFRSMGSEDEIAFAEIVRRQLDEKGRVEAISERARRVMEKGGGFGAVDDYLNSVYAAPDERQRSAETVARQYAESLARKGAISSAEIETMRAWVSRDAPGSVDRLTGEARTLMEKISGSAVKDRLPAELE